MLYPSLLARLRNQHEAIVELLHGVDGLRIHRHPAEGKWSIHDNIAHLARYQPVFLERLHAMATVRAPVFERYRAEEDADFPEWRARATPELLSTLNSDRAGIVEYLLSLENEALQRTGIHKKFGRMTLVQWTEFFLLHEAHHLFTIFQLVRDTE